GQARRHHRLRRRERPCDRIASPLRDPRERQAAQSPADADAALDDSLTTQGGGSGARYTRRKPSRSNQRSLCPIRRSPKALAERSATIGGYPWSVVHCL